MSTWHPLGSPRDFSHRRGTPRRIGSHRLAVFRLDDDFFVTDEKCPHAGAPLCSGVFKGLLVSCPRHKWRFNVRDGRCLTNELFSLKSYPTRLHNGQVEVQLG